MRLWIKDPLAILAEGAERGIVVDGRRNRRMRRPRRSAGNSARRDLRRLAPCRAARARQRPSSFLPDADPRPSRRPRQGPHPVARGDGAGLGPHDAGGAQDRGQDGACRTDAVGLHDRRRPPQSLSARPRGRHRHRGRRGDEARAADDGEPRLNGHFREGRRPPAGLDRPGFGDDPRGQRAGAAALSRPQCQER